MPPHSRDYQTRRLPHPLTRRNFLRGSAAVGLLAGFECEYIITLAAWFSGDLEVMLAKLKKNKNPNHQRRTLGDFIGNTSRDGWP